MVLVPRPPPRRHSSEIIQLCNFGRRRVNPNKFKSFSSKSRPFSFIKFAHPVRFEQQQFLGSKRPVAKKGEVLENPRILKKGRSEWRSSHSSTAIIFALCIMLLLTRKQSAPQSRHQLQHFYDLLNVSEALHAGSLIGCHLRYKKHMLLPNK